MKFLSKWWPWMIIAAFLILLMGMFLSISDTEDNGQQASVNFSYRIN